MFPKFLLKRMYVKESLNANDDNSGFNYIIKNSIANGNVTEVYLLSINDEEVPFTEIMIKNETQEMSADKITVDTPIELKKGVNTIFKIKKSIGTLIDQEVKIHMKFKVQVHDSKVTIDFDFKDVLKKN